MRSVALFRSCLRKEYRDQVIKMLRAVPGEYTRTSYRLQWIDPEVLDLIESGDDLKFISHVVNPAMTHALPCRTMTLVEPPVLDTQVGVYRFSFELGPFVVTPPGYDAEIRSWSADPDRTPPSKFISTVQENLPKLAEIGYAQSQQVWKDSVSFLTNSWSDFSNTVFFRPHGDDYEGRPAGPRRVTRQAERESFRFFAFNPHMTYEHLAQRSIHVSIGDVLGDVESISPLPLDGFFDVNLNFLEPGRASVQVEIRPDEQFSAYVPLTVQVEQNLDLDPSGPRVLGPEWKRFLEDTAKQAAASPDEVLSLFGRLSNIFPGDPELSIQTGLVHYSHGQFAAARHEFAKALSVRQDPQAVWWSFLAALRQDDKRDTEILIERLDLSRQDLFETAVETMPRLPDRTAEWFSELPGLAFGEDKAVRLLLGMLSSPRGEPASCAIVRAIGELNGKSGLRQARATLSMNPDWSEMRRLAVSIARKTGMYEQLQDDIDLLMHYPGGPVDDYMATVTALYPLVHPQRLPGLLISNAIRLAASREPEDVKAALALATLAAEQAASNGDFIAAQNAIQFVEMNLRHSTEEVNNYRPQIAQIVSRMSNALQSIPGLAELGDEYLKEVASELRPDYVDRKVVIFGGRQPSPERIDAWSEELGAKEMVWVGSTADEGPDAKKLLQVVDQNTTLIVMTLDDALITESIRDWLREQRIPVMRAMETKASIYGALRALAPSSDSLAPFVPQSCSEALSWAMVNCPHLGFSPDVDADIEELDAMQNWSHVALRIKADLELLNRFAEEQKAGKVAIGFYNWAQLNGYSSNLLALRESESTDNRKWLRRERMFRVPVEVDPTGEIYMPAHTKLPGKYPIKPRIHFSLDTLTTVGKIYIGYVGPHRTTIGTN
jgi:hypothetical protein